MMFDFEQKDYMIRAMAANEEVRAFAVTSRNLVEEARKAHDTSPVCTAALGRTMSAALMMSDMLKDKDALLTINFEGDGPIGGITATADNNGNVKGYVVNPDVDLPLRADGHLDVGRAVGRGTLTVIRDMDRDHTYNGQVAIHSGEIADDLTHYFAESEQIPSVVDLGVLVDTDCTVKHAGGFIIQLMPFASEETISHLEQNVQNLDRMTDMQDQGLSPEQMLDRVLDGFDVQITETIPVQFHCNCSEERVREALKLFGQQELDSMIEDSRASGEDTEVTCHFCGKRYRFTVGQLEEIRAEIS